MSQEQDMAILRADLRKRLADHKDTRFLYQILQELSANVPAVEFPGTRYTQLDDELIDVVIKHLEAK